MTTDTHAHRLGRSLARWLGAAFTLDVRSLAVYRIGLGLILIADSLFRTRDFSLMLAPDGMFPLPALACYQGTSTLWSLAALHDSSASSATLLALQGVAGVALAVGWHTRLATFAGWVALVSVIRRAAPTANAGDIWLACQMFWSLFLPLGVRWSIDSVRRRAAAAPTPLPTSALSVATAAFILQVAVVYLGAGLAKCNADWISGDALMHALSVHDHGNAAGMSLAGMRWLVRPVQWLVLGGELVLPIMILVCPTPRIRIGLVVMFITFHVAIWLTMTVGLFPLIGIVVWLALVPGDGWSSAERRTAGRVVGLGRPATWACGVALSVAACAFVHGVCHPPGTLLPRLLAVPVNLTGLHQEWKMFATVPAREQWVYARGLLADGTEIDLLRRGRPLERDRPAGGFTSLPHHRWHSFLWNMVRPRAKCLAEPAAAALARRWNAVHSPHRHVVSVEVRYAFQPAGEPDAAVLDFVLASWPSRSAGGSGNLERFLQDAAADRAGEER